MTLYWGGRRPKDLYMNALAESGQPSTQFKYVPVISDALPEDGWSGRTGFVHRAVMQDFPDLSGHQVYACGVPIMVDSAQRDFIARLQAAGGRVLRRQLHHPGRSRSARQRLRPSRLRAPADSSSSAFAFARKRDRAGFHDVAAARELEREPRVLLDQQDGHARARRCRATISKIFATISGARPIDGSSSSSSFGSRHQRARHREHLLLAARERAGDLVAPLLQAREALRTALAGRRRCARRRPSPGSPRTVSCAKMPRPSGTMTRPRRGSSWTRAREMSAPS